MGKRLGKGTILFESRPKVCGFAAIGGKKEGNGPFGKYFDRIEKDSFFGEKTWEKAEKKMQSEALETACGKAGTKPSKLDMLFGGDLLNQCISTGFAARESGAPFIGLYGACSTMAESAMLAAMAVDGGFAERAAAITSSHFCTAERQFRTPLEYGGQRTPASQWTATASGAAVISSKEGKISAVYATAGRVCDMGITDVNNMGAAMAPAAFDTMTAFFSDTGIKPSQIGLIVTGDLGRTGEQIVRKLFSRENVKLGDNYRDCGSLLYGEKGDTHSGGSGCGCSAAMLCGYIFNEMSRGNIKSLLFCGTGALHSPISCGQGESVPAICHAVYFESGE